MTAPLDAPLTTDVLDQVTDAARLIEYGMRPKQIPARDLDYEDLVRRYSENGPFASIVDATAKGFDLIVLDVNRQSGIVLAAREESVFTVKFEEYARRTALSGRSADKVIHGLAHLAVAALAFPRPDDLANDTYVGNVTVAEVDAVVRDACRVLEEQAKAAEENNDPLETAPDLERAWRAYARRPATSATKDGRLSPDSTRGMITKAVRFLADQGALVQRNQEHGGTYRTTPRYQVQVRELAATAAYRELLALDVVTHVAASGTLRSVNSETI